MLIVGLAIFFFSHSSVRLIDTHYTRVRSVLCHSWLSHTTSGLGVYCVTLSVTHYRRVAGVLCHSWLPHTTGGLWVYCVTLDCHTLEAGYECTVSRLTVTLYRRVMSVLCHAWLSHTTGRTGSGRTGSALVWYSECRRFAPHSVQ